MKELWKNIPDHYGYQASNKGRIRSFRAGKRGNPFLLSPSFQTKRRIYSSEQIR